MRRADLCVVAHMKLTDAASIHELFMHQSAQLHHHLRCTLSDSVIGNLGEAMPPSRLSVAVLTSLVKDLSDGVSVKTVCRRYHVSPPTVYRWRKKLRAQGISSIERLHQLQNENRQLKRKIAELSLDYSTLRIALISQTKTEC